MDQKVVHEVMVQTQAGSMIFPDVVQQLVEAGVESYFCDLAAGSETFYGCAGTTHVETMTLPAAAAAEEFSATGIQAAIRGAQADTVRYPEFVQLSREAGVTAYWAFLTGRKVVYFGRKGEQHVEPFPSSR
jgi:uncharacterized protein YbcV (DUF1398 family)